MNFFGAVFVHFLPMVFFFMSDCQPHRVGIVYVIVLYIGLYANGEKHSPASLNYRSLLWRQFLDADVSEQVRFLALPDSSVPAYHKNSRFWSVGL